MDSSDLAHGLGPGSRTRVLPRGMGAPTQKRSRMIRRFFLLLSLVLPICLRADETRLIVAVGAEGAEEYLATFKQWSSNWAEAGKAAGANQTILGVDPGQKDSDFPRL